MSMKSICVLFLILGSISCKFSEETDRDFVSDLPVEVVGTLKNVMQKGELQGRLDLDTIANRDGLYGLGPEAFLTG